MESKSCDTSLSRSDLNSAFCDTSQNSLSSVDTLSFGEGSSRQDCAFEQSAHKDVQTICSNESSKAGASDSGTELTARTEASSNPMEQSLSNSIYLDNGTDPRGKLVTPKPKTRLTMAERARLEALASFGGAALETVFVKHDGLRDKLRRQKEEALQAQCRPDDRAGEEGPGNSSECAVFDSSLGDLRVKKVDLKAKLKQEAEDRGKENMPLPPAKKSRHQLAHEQSQANLTFEDCFKREGRDGLPSFRKATSQNDNSSSSESVPIVKRMTRVERSKMEALQSFGAGLQDLTVKPRIPKVLEEKLAIKRKANNN